MKRSIIHFGGLGLLIGLIALTSWAWLRPVNAQLSTSGDTPSPDSSAVTDETEPTASTEEIQGYPGQDDLITPPVLGGQGQPTQIVTYTTHFENKSSQAIDFSLEVYHETWETNFSIDQTGVLSPGQGLPLTVTVQIPVTATVGDSGLSIARLSGSNGWPVYDDWLFIGTAVTCQPTFNYQGTSIPTTDPIDDIITFNGQKLAQVLVEVSDIQGNNIWQSTVQGYNSNTNMWELLPSDWSGFNLVADYTTATPIYDKIRIETSDPYTPARYHYHFTVCREPLIILEAPYVERLAEAGETAVYTTTLTNSMIASDQFTLATAGNQWSTTLMHGGIPITQTDMLTDLEEYPITVAVSVPATATIGMSDSVTLTATSLLTPTVNQSIVLTTTVTSGEIGVTSQETPRQLLFFDRQDYSLLNILQLEDTCNVDELIHLGDEVVVHCNDQVNVVNIHTSEVQQLVSINAVHVVLSDNGRSLSIITRENDYYYIYADYLTVFDTSTWQPLGDSLALDHRIDTFFAHPYKGLVYAYSTQYDLLTIDILSLTTVNNQITYNFYYNNNYEEAAIDPLGRYYYLPLSNGLRYIDYQTLSAFNVLDNGFIQYNDSVVLSRSGHESLIYNRGSSDPLIYSLDIDAQTPRFTRPLSTDNSVLGLVHAEPSCDDQTILAHTYPVDSSSADLIELNWQGDILQEIDWSLPITNSLYRYDKLALCPEIGQLIYTEASEATAGRGETAQHVVWLINREEVTTTIDLQIVDGAWTTTPSTTTVGPIPPRSAMTMTVDVAIPPTVDWYATDEAMITAVTPWYTQTIPLTTQAYASPTNNSQFTALNRTITTGDILTTSWAISNTNGVTLTVSLQEEADFFSFTPTTTTLSIAQPQNISPVVIRDTLGDVYYDDVTQLAVSTDDNDMTVSVQFNTVISQPDTHQGYLFFDMDQNPQTGIAPSYLIKVYATSQFDLGIERYAHINDEQLYLYSWQNNSSILIDVYTSTTPSNTLTWQIPLTALGDQDNKFHMGSMFGMAFNVIDLVPESGYIPVGYDAPWFTVNPEAIRLTDNSNTLLDVTWDATGLQPGIYTTTLALFANTTPYQDTIPVQMNVMPTGDLGWVEGLVTDFRFGNSISATISANGISVQAEADGYYKLWLPEGNHTLAITSDGYISETAVIDITTTQPTLQPFALMPDAPWFVVETTPPNYISQTVASTQTHSFILRNDGPQPLAYTIIDRSFEHTHNTNDTINIVIWRDGSDPDEYTDIVNAITQHLPNAQITPIDFIDLFTLNMALTDANVFLVPALSGLSSSEYNFVRYQLPSVLDDFIEAGGTYIMTGQYCWDNAFLFYLGLPDCGYITNVDELIVLEPAHPYVTNVPETFVYDSELYRYALPDDNSIAVLGEPYPAPNTVSPAIEVDREGGEVALLGFRDVFTIDNLKQLLANIVQDSHSEADWIGTESQTKILPPYSSEEITLTTDTNELIQPRIYKGAIKIATSDPYSTTEVFPLAIDTYHGTDTEFGYVYGEITNRWTGDPVTATVQLGDFVYNNVTNYEIWETPGTHELIVTAPGYYTYTQVVTIVQGIDGTSYPASIMPYEPHMVFHTDEIAVFAEVEHPTFTYNLPITNAGPVTMTTLLYTTQAENRSSAPLQGKQILIDGYHSRGGFTLNGITADLVEAGATISITYSGITTETLNNYDIFWIPEHNWLTWSQEEASIIQNWVLNGGSLFIYLVDYTYAYHLIPAFEGLTYVSHWGNPYITYPSILYPHQITYGINDIIVEEIADYITPTTDSNFTVVTRQSVNNIPETIVGDYGSGRVVILNSEMLHTYAHLDNGDNRQMAMNLFNWLARPQIITESWVTVPEVVSIPPFSTVEVPISFDTPNVPAGTYSTTLYIETDDPLQTEMIFVPVSLIVIDEVVAPMTSLSSNELTVEAGETAVYTLTITHTNSVPDTYQLTVAEGLWDTTITPMQTDTLQQGESATIILRITPPKTASGSDTTTVTISSANFVQLEENIQVTTTVQYHTYLPFIIRN